MTKSWAPRTTRLRWVALATTAAVLTTAGLLWLSQASALAATGLRIFEVERDRADLLQRRSRLLVAHAQATDPARLEARAAVLGFGPPDVLEHLPMALPPLAVDDGLDLTHRSTLALVRFRDPRPPTEMGLLDRLLSVGPARIAARTAGTATIGESPP